MFKYSDFIKIIVFSAFILSGCGENPPQGVNLPLVMISYPPNNAYVKDTVIIKAEAIDNVEIKKVSTKGKR